MTGPSLKCWTFEQEGDQGQGSGLASVPVSGPITLEGMGCPQGESLGLVLFMAVGGEGPH